MATIINNPPASVQSTDSGMGAIFAIILAVVIIGALLVVGIPWLRSQTRGGGNGASVNVPSQIDVNVPDKVNVDVNQQPAQ